MHFMLSHDLNTEINTTGETGRTSQEVTTAVEQGSPFSGSSSLIPHLGQPSPLLPFLRCSTLLSYMPSR